MHRRTLIAAAAFAARPPPRRPRAADAPPRFAGAWPGTDFSKRSIPLDEIMSGGVPKDGIPALDTVRFAGAGDLDPREPVITVALDGAAPRAYPLRYLTWHEIANDTIAGVPVAVTYCPLCNAAMVFDRRVRGRVLDFGVSGLLRHSDLVMYDRQTQSWWQQFTGEAIVGEMTGARLDILPSWVEPLSAYLAEVDQPRVMQRPRAHSRAYGRNPYVGYDSARRPFLYRGEDPPHGIPPLARVVSARGRAWPLERLAGTRVIEEAGLRLEWRGAMASALDSASIAQGRDVGAIRVFDAQTGAPVVHDVVFAFAFHAFHPDGQWMLGEG